MTRTREKLIVVAVVAVYLFLLCAVVLPNFIRARSTSAQNACINNLRQIDGAKQQWALENNITNDAKPSWANVQPYMGRGSQGESPKCPQGGTYILGRLSELPSCSIGGPRHTLPQ
jgi:hypothetical protein